MPTFHGMVGLLVAVALLTGGARPAVAAQDHAQAVNAGLDGLDVHGLAIDPTTPEKLHAAVRDTGEGLYRTTDGGGKWTRVDDGPGGEVKVLASVNISTGMGGIWLYAGTGAGLQRDPDCF